MTRTGGSIVAGAAAAGLAIATYNYFSPVGFLSPLSNTSGTVGALVPIASTIILIIAGVILEAGDRGSWTVTIFAALAIICIVGTGFAAILLDSMPLLLTMVVAIAGWFLWLAQWNGRRPGVAAVK